MLHLKRYFLFASLPAFFVVLLFNYYSHNKATQQMLIEQETRANVNQASILQQLVWPRFANFVNTTLAPGFNHDAGSDAVRQLNELFFSILKGTNIEKIKIYNLNGVTIYSTQKSQIGADKSANSGFISARKGRVFSNLTFRNQFHAIEKIIVDRNLLTSYIPLYNRETGEVAAVFEMYSDVTDLVISNEVMNNRDMGISILSFSLLFILLYLIVRHADKHIQRTNYELKYANSRIRELAFQDGLTELPNRNSFMNHLDILMKQRRQNEGFALLYVDVDHFKRINDGYGHTTGDMVLRTIAGRLVKSIRASDRVYRLAGDEFTIILPNTNNKEAIEKVADNIIENLSQPVILRGVDNYLSVSIGIAVFPDHTDSPEVLIEVADKAMYQAKQTGENRYEFADQTFAEQSVEPAINDSSSFG